MSQAFEELWTGFLEGELDSGDLAALEQLLADDEALLQKAASLYEEHRLLGFQSQAFDGEQFIEETVSQIETDDQRFVSSVITELQHAALPSHESRAKPIENPSLRKHWMGYVLVAAFSLLIGGAAWFFQNTMTGKHDAQSLAEGNTSSQIVPIATLLLEENCVWSSGTQLGEGQRLTAQTLDLQSGVAVVRFDGSAELVMTGEASLILQSAGSAKLRYGEVVIRAEAGAEGFRLATPASPLVDLGTEFAVRVDRTGTTEVHVLDGEVEYQKGNQSNVLSAGKAIRFSSVEKTVEKVELDSPRFEEVVQRINPKSQPQRMFAYEGFYYDPGSLPLAQTTKGKGWDGPWRLRLPEERSLPAQETSPEQFKIVHGQMNVTWPVPGGRLGMLELPGGGAYYVRPLKRSIDLDRDAVTYFSLMVQETERRTDSKSPRERLRLTFRSSEDYYKDWISFGHGPGYRPHVQSGPGVSHTSPMVLPPEQTTLWIGKIVSRKSGEDEIYFRVYGEDDVLGYAEPATWHVVTRGVELDSHFDRVLLSSNGITARIVDELRIGPTWRSVAPML